MTLVRSLPPRVLVGATLLGSLPPRVPVGTTLLGSLPPRDPELILFVSCIAMSPSSAFGKSHILAKS